MKKPLLTRRQRQVLCLIAQGLIQKQVADRLGLKPKTINNHMGQVHMKLRLGTAVELTHFAIAHRMIPIRTEFPVSL